MPYHYIFLFFRKLWVFSKIVSHQNLQNFPFLFSSLLSFFVIFSCHSSKNYSIFVQLFSTENYTNSTCEYTKTQNTHTYTSWFIVKWLKFFPNQPRKHLRSFYKFHLSQINLIQSLATTYEIKLLPKLLKTARPP